MDIVKNFVIDVNASDLDRNLYSACIYCGDTTNLTRDHVVPVSWSGFKRNYEKGTTVKCCRQCNSMLANIPLHSISKRANYLASALSRKYQRILNHPRWEESELDEMESYFKSTIISRTLMKNYIMARISHCTLIALEDNDNLKDKHQLSTDVEDYKILQDFYHGYSLDEISEKFGIGKDILKTMFKTKKRRRIVNAFKYEKGIPFESSIYGVFKKIRDNPLFLIK